MAWELLVVERMPRARTRERPLLVGGAHLVSVGIGCLLMYSLPCAGVIFLVWTAVFCEVPVRKQ